MKRMISISALVLGLSASIAQAQTIAEQVRTQLTSQGYDTIEIKEGRGQIRVEATRGGQKLEVVYDAATGEILSQEVSALDGSSSRDSSDDSDDDHDDDSDDDRDDDSDDDRDDDSDDDRDDDSDDDHDDDSDDDRDDDSDDDRDDDRR
mgnify:CR=1 FL=1